MCRTYRSKTVSLIRSIQTFHSFPTGGQELENRSSLYPPKSSESLRQPEPEVTREVIEVKPDIHEVKEDNKENENPEEEEEHQEPEPAEEPVKPEVELKKPEIRSKKPEILSKKPDIEIKKPEMESSSEVSDRKEEEPAKNIFGGVVLRRTGKLSNIGDHGTLRADKIKDASKRQTIAGDSAVVTVFTGSPSRASQRSSVHEPADWEKLEAKTKEAKAPPAEDATGAGNEFSQVFSKLRNRTSNISALVEADQRPPDDGGPVKEIKPFTRVATKPKAAATPVAKEVAASKPEVVVTKPVVKEEETKEEEPPKTERPRSTSPGAKDSNKLDENKPVVVVPATDKPKDLTKSDNEKKVEAQPFKRDSPVLRDRERSKTTIGTPPVQTTTPESKGSPSVKRTQSHKVTPVSATAPSSQPADRPADRPALKPAPKWEPKKPAVDEAQSTGGQPSWIAMARRKTGGWDENRDPEKELKEASNKAKKEDDDEARIIIDVRHDGITQAASPH